MRNAVGIGEGTPSRGRNLGYPNRRKQSDSAGQNDPIDCTHQFQWEGQAGRSHI